MKQTAVILPNWVGDLAMATPALRALRKRWPDATITGVVRPGIRDVLSGTHWIDEYLDYDPRSRNRTLWFSRVAQRLRRRRPDVVVAFPNSLRAGLLAWWSGAPVRIGYARSGRGPLLTHALRPPRAGGRWLPVSAVDYYLGLAAAAGCDAEQRRLELQTTSENEARAASIWAELGLGTDVVGVNTGGARGPSKAWPVEYAANLAQRITAEHQTDVLVLCGPQESAAAAAIERQAASPRVRSLAGHPTGLGELKAVIRRLSLLVSTDSGPRHLAAGLGIPTVSLIGPVDRRWSENGNPDSLVLAVDVDCGPCGRRTCPVGHHRCMRDLTVDMVATAVRRIRQPALIAQPV